MQRSLAAQKYKKLIQEIGHLFEQARHALADCYWEIGKRIVNIEQEKQIRAAYGANLLERLSKDLTKKYGEGFSQRNLERMRKFYLTYPKSTAPSKLCWTHYAELLNLKEPDMRARYESIAEQNRLSHRQLRKLIREENALLRGHSPRADRRQLGILKDGTPATLKSATNLRSGIFGTATEFQSERLKAQPGHVLVDCGFHVVRTMPRSDVPISTRRPDYLYPATIERVIDGDTLMLIIDCGGGVFIRQSIRLRGINALEVDTPRGKQAKHFVERTLKDAPTVVIRTYSTDLHGRYVADLLYLPGEADPAVIQRDGKYLNQELLDAGHAYAL
ncbi:MAG: thermonuclease family protein [Candidatus Omnitrophica bacterium]|nr:thermonuclease family protein [Candidatus Omnitrophota bacterium]